MSTKSHSNPAKTFSSFNPKWCLGPPPVSKNIVNPSKNKPIARRCYRKPSKINGEPTSPRIGCMGQIVRCKAQTVKTTSSSSSSGSSSSSSASSSLFSSAVSPSDVSNQFSLLMLKRSSTVNGSVHRRFEEMDPPKPIERKERGPTNGGSDGLLSRRCKGRVQELKVHLPSVDI